jgi:serine/threonine protein kinase
VTEAAPHRRFRLLRCIGQGSFGRVYQAEMLTGAGLVRPVALKVYIESQGAPAEGLARFRDEARLMARISHRCLVPVIDLIHLPMGWTIVMEWVEGVDAAAFMDDRAVPARVALAIVAEVASALATAWESTSEDGSPLRLLHRDIKPNNIRVSLHGDVRLLDFGAARGDLQGREAKTTRWRLGTIPYMAPERMDEGVEDPSCDVLSLGLVALDLMRGVMRPNVLPREPQTARYRELLREELVDWGMLNEEDAASVVDLLRRMTDPRGDQRPTAREVADQADALADRLPGPRPAAWMASEARSLAAAHTTRAVEDPWTGRIVSQTLPITDKVDVPRRLSPAPDEQPTVYTDREPPAPVTLPAPRPITQPAPVPPPEPTPPPDPTPEPTPPVARWRWLVAGAAALGAAFALLPGAPGPAPVEAPPLAEAPTDVVAPAPTPPAPTGPDIITPPIPKETKAKGAKIEGTRTEGTTARETKAPEPQPSAPPPIEPPKTTPAEPEPPPAAPSKAVVTHVSIEAGRTLKARRDGQSVALPGSLPAGTWELVDDRGTRRGSLTVADGERLTITCNERTSICRR